MDEAQRDKMACELARQHLRHLKDLRKLNEKTDEIVEEYLKPEGPEQLASTLAEIYQRILESAQNADRKARVIGGVLGKKIEKLKPVVCDFDPEAVVEKYTTRAEVLDAIKQAGFKKLPKRISRKPRNLWWQYCQTILDGARFLSQFPTAKDFHEWVKQFDEDERMRPAVALILHEEIKGLGFALACVSQGDGLHELWKTRQTIAGDF